MSAVPISKVALFLPAYFFSSVLFFFFSSVLLFFFSPFLPFLLFFFVLSILFLLSANSSSSSSSLFLCDDMHTEYRELRQPLTTAQVPQVIDIPTKQEGLSENGTGRRGRLRGKHSNRTSAGLHCPPDLTRCADFLLGGIFRKSAEKRDTH